MTTVLQMKHAALESLTFGKVENETRPFRKELITATPQETPDGHGTIVGGTSEEGPPSIGCHKAIGRHRTVRNGGKAKQRERAIRAKWPFPIKRAV